MSDKSSTEYISAKILAESGFGWLNTGSTQASRDGHLAGTLERQESERRRKQEQVRTDERREAYRERRRIEQQFEREEAQRKEVEDRERKIDELFYDTLGIGEKLVSGVAKPIERDAYWFLRKESENLAKAANDPLLARRFNLMMRDLPIRSSSKPPPAPREIYDLAVSLCALRNKLMNAGIILPFDDFDSFSGRYTMFHERAETNRSDFTYMLFPGQYEVGNLPNWLKQDEPILSPTPIAVERDSNGEDEEGSWSQTAEDGGISLNGDVVELSQRFKAIDNHRVELIESIRVLRERFQIFLDLDVDIVPVETLSWVEWSAEIRVSGNGYFSEVLSSPKDSLKFVLDHEDFLTRLINVDPENLLEGLMSAARNALGEHCAVEMAIRHLRCWATSAELNPPDLGKLRATKSIGFLDNVTKSREDLNDALSILSLGVTAPFFETLEIHSHLQGGLVGVGQSDCRKFFADLNACFAERHYYANRVSQDDLTILVARKVARVRGAFPSSGGVLKSFVLPEISNSTICLASAWITIAQPLESACLAWASGLPPKGDLGLVWVDEPKIGLEENEAKFKITFSTTLKSSRASDLVAAIESRKYLGNDKSRSKQSGLPVYVLTGLAVVIASVVAFFLRGYPGESQPVVESTPNYSVAENGVAMKILSDDFFIKPKRIYPWPESALVKPDVFIAVRDNSAALCMMEVGCTEFRRLESQINGSRSAVLGNGYGISISPGLDGNMPILSTDGDYHPDLTLPSGFPFVTVVYKENLIGGRTYMGSNAMRIEEVALGQSPLAIGYEAIDEFSIFISDRVAKK
ncbi:hypothetical protein LDO26_17120 [Luteimonas sp. BDR2-5]|uniref:hypothetical protein n=1 Tax=Proluteimonas luteida TaxID=2878685 RepID=UPI001E510A3A|nr:hypothetical protein [Luteimonas sp. BDR2-5]MCD9029915.1 hypothetical protein [Luteimonas sp. BDR2-5]